MKSIFEKTRLPDFPRNSLRRLGIVHDILVSFLSIFLAMILSWGLVAVFSIWQIWALIGGFTLISALIFPFFSLNSGAWRYASLLDAVSIVKATSLIVTIFLAISFVIFRGDYLPRQSVVMVWFIQIIGLCGPRLAYRLMKERASGIRHNAENTNDPHHNILIYGYSDTADLFIRNARRARSQRAILGILDEKPKNRKRQLHGVKVLGGINDLPNIAQTLASKASPVRELVVANPNLTPHQLTEIVTLSVALKIIVKRLPDIGQGGIIDENAPIEPQPIALKDLLGRKEITLDVGKVGNLIDHRRVLITGAGGSIGSELVRQIAAFSPDQLILVDNSEFNLWTIERQVRDIAPDLAVIGRAVDIRQKDRVEKLFAGLKPEIIFHAAAMKHVPIVEDNPFEGLQTNIIGTRNVANAALAHQAAAFVMVSTDKAVNPTNIMGATKRVAESYCQALDEDQSKTRFMTVRFGNVMGSRGSVIPLFQSQLAKGGPLTVTDPKITRFFMTIPEASRLILHAAGHGIGNDEARGQIYVLDMGKPILITELAERLIQLAGLRPHTDIAIRYTGLRKGEKLFEELFAQDERRETTSEPGLLVARSRVRNRISLNEQIDQIAAALEENEPYRGIEILRQIVPEFTPFDHQAPLETKTSDAVILPGPGARRA